MSDVVVTMEHARKAGMCARGVRSFFRRRGLDFRKFMQDGMPASELEKLNDAMVDQVVEVARGK